MNNLKEEFIYLCSLFASCTYRSQGTGGNISVKENDTVIIKASGTNLISVSQTSGYTLCSIQKILDCLEKDNEGLDHTLLEKTEAKPSMEAFFHILPKKYIVHIHPTFFCKYLSKKNSEYIFSTNNFQESLFIEYAKPGLDLGKKILSKYTGESIIFLQNHGIILLHNSIESIVQLYKQIIRQLENVVGEQYTGSNICLEHFVRKSSGLCIKPIYNLILPSTFIPITPDHYLFLKKNPFILTSHELEDKISLWKTTKDYPSIIQVDNHVYSLGKNIQQCQTKEDYLRSYIDIVFRDDIHSYSLLSDAQLEELTSCRKEIYRSNI